jgi:hypothetical protein
MALAKVQSTRSSATRMASTPNGRGVIPRPVLGQRKYANPSNGDSSIYSTRQSASAAPFHFVDSLTLHNQRQDEMSGGVLRTREGQIHGRKQLNLRVGQLDGIADAVKEVGLSPAKSTTGPLPGSLPGDVEQTKIQLNLAIQQLSDGANEAQAAVNRLVEEEEAENNEDDNGENDEEDRTVATLDTQAVRKLNVVVGNLAERGFGQTYQLMRLVFVLAPNMSEKDLNELYAKVSGVNATLEEVTDRIGELAREYGVQSKGLATENVLSLSAILVRLTSYLKGMVDAVNRSDGERLQVSNALIKSLKFGKDLKRTSTPFLTGLVHPDEQRQIRLVQNDILAEEPRFLGAGLKSEAPYKAFSRRQPTREDSEQSVKRGDRSGFKQMTPREEFGYASGEWYKSNGRGESEFFDNTRPKNSNGPGYEALSKLSRPLTTRMSKTFDKVTGGYNVAFG